MTKQPQPSITIVLSQETRATKQRIKATTWGTRDGVYGSLGVVYFPVALMSTPQTKDDLARVVLTALFGMEYDL